MYSRGVANPFVIASKYWSFTCTLILENINNCLACSTHVPLNVTCLMSHVLCALSATCYFSQYIIPIVQTCSVYY